MAKTDCKPLPSLSEADIARFWKYVHILGRDECWPWTGALSKVGYGVLGVSVPGGGNYPARRVILASRISIFIATGIDPFPLFACHRCDNPPCCNPAHIFRGSLIDNNADMGAKNRIRHGENHRSAKLSEDQVIEIRKRYAEGGVLQRELAEEFRVARSNIYLIVSRKNWRRTVGPMPNAPRATPVLR